MDECQIPGLPRMAEGPAAVGAQPLLRRVKRLLSRPWNYGVKKALKRIDRALLPRQVKPVSVTTRASLAPGAYVRVRQIEEIRATLDRWKELRGCAFLEYMEQYCGTTQRVLLSMERFLDERDYKVKKCRGIVLLEGVVCHGTPVFGRCDRCCHLFWREEWLEVIPEAEY